MGTTSQCRDNDTKYCWRAMPCDIMLQRQRHHNMLQGQWHVTSCCRDN